MNDKIRENGQPTVIITFKGNDLFLKQLDTDLRKQLAKTFHLRKDDKHGGCRMRPIDFWSIKEYLISQGIKCQCEFSTNFPLNLTLKTSFTIRSYQLEAFQSWQDNDNQGVVILPTGSGKTYLGIYILAQLNIKTLIVVPTLELVDQWYTRLQEKLSAEDHANDQFEGFIGKFGGGKKEIKPITITTYDSAYLYLPKFRATYGLLILDEIHHLSGEKYRLIAEGSIIPNRLGLTATLQEDTEEYAVIEKLVGDIVYRKKPAELTQLGQLASYKVKQIKVNLSPELLEDYTREQKQFLKYLKKFIRAKNPFKQVIYRSNQDPKAKQALKSYRKAKNIAFNSEKKITVIREILEEHLRDRILVFCEHISFVEKLSREFFIPALTSNTPSSERKKIMQNFRTGKYRILSSGKILDEGVDVPEASVGIIVSGTGTQRQFIQRLGRLLRPLPNKQALLYEIITQETTEMRLSSRRTRWRRK